MSNYISSFFSHLNSENIDYAVLRNYEQLPESIGESDLDILVGRNDIIRFNALMEIWLKEFNGTIVSIIKDNDYSKYCILGKNGQWWGIQIDVFENNILYNGKDILDKEIIWDNIEKFRGIKVLNKSTGSLLAYLKEILNNGSCSKKYYDELKCHFSENSKELENLLNGTFPKEFISELIQLVRKDYDKREIKINAAHGRKIFSIQLIKRISSFIKKFKRINRNPGFTIIFMGTDGAGKSTIIDKIKPVLSKTYHKSVYYEHLRPNYIPSLAKLMGKEVKEGPVTDPHAKNSSGLAMSLFRLSYYLVDYIAGYYVKVFPKKAFKSCVWIFDRYYYDYLIDQKRVRIKLPPWLLKSVQLFVPKPDILICLGADAQVIHSRKPELALDEVKRQVNELKKMCTKKEYAVWIDTGKSIEESIDEVLISIQNIMYKRFDYYKLG